MQKLLLFALPLLLTGCFAPAPADPTPVSDGVVFCTQDAKECPDGSFVSRVSPSCEFAACSTSTNPNPVMSETKTISLAEIQKLKLDCTEADWQTACPAVGEPIAKITTTEGEIYLRLFASKTPKTVENFVGLSERGYYNGIIFHRVIPDFMIQGGDPDGRGTGGTSIWGTDFEDEFVPGLSNIRGALSMANRGPGTNGSQFFIVQNSDGATFLDGRHTVFGQVFSGLSVVDAIAHAERDGMDKPLIEIAMKQVEILEVTK